jgi:hypothetical protein
MAQHRSLSLRYFVITYRNPCPLYILPFQVSADGRSLNPTPSTYAQPLKAVWQPHGMARKHLGPTRLGRLHGPLFLRHVYILDTAMIFRECPDNIGSCHGLQ